MSGGSGGSSGSGKGSTGGRPPRGGNEDITARHGRGGAEPTPDADATTSGRPTRTGENDANPADPDAPDDVTP